MGYDIDPSPANPSPGNPGMSCDGPRWYVASSLPKAEFRAKLNLERQGWRTFFPRYSASTRSGTRLINTLRPLFAGYVFVEMDIRHSRWRSVNGTYGVRSIIENGDGPAPLPRGCVEEMISMSSSNEIFSFVSQLREGSRVRFVRGPFSGFIGTLEELDPLGRVRVLLELLGRQSSVRTSAADLVPASVVAN